MKKAFAAVVAAGMIAISGAPAAIATNYPPTQSIAVDSAQIGAVVVTAKGFAANSPVTWTWQKTGSAFGSGGRVAAAVRAVDSGSRNATANSSGSSTVTLPISPSGVYKISATGKNPVNGNPLTLTTTVTLASGGGGGTGGVTVVTAVPGAVKVSVGGFMPGTVVTFTFRGGSVKAVAGPDGVATAVLPINSSGTYRITATGTGANGAPLTKASTIKLTLGGGGNGGGTGGGANGGGSGLPTTGSNAASLLLFGGGALAIGAGAVIVSRRRRESADA